MRHSALELQRGRRLAAVNGIVSGITLGKVPYVTQGCGQAAAHLCAPPPTRLIHVLTWVVYADIESTLA